MLEYFSDYNTALTNYKEEEKTEEQQDCLVHPVSQDLTDCSEDPSILYQTNLGQDMSSKCSQISRISFPFIIIFDTVFTDELEDSVGRNTLILINISF